jgi:probable F420-dependent oxidoreductase
MKFDATLRGIELKDAGPWAGACEELGFDGIWTTETNTDPYFPLVLAATETKRVDLGTGIALAFPRSPTHLAHSAWDLNTLSQGRFILGLGSQVKAHVVRRFSAEYERPVARMREVVEAVRAIWTTWSDGSPLDFRGEFFQHTLMPPAFCPPDLGFGHPRIALAGVQPRMTELAGEVADIFLAHPLQTRSYVAETLVPAIERGLEAAGRERSDIEISLALFAISSDEERADVRRRIAFYASTPQYRPVLEAHGWGMLGEELHALTRAGKWDELPNHIPDEVIDEVAVSGTTAQELAEQTRARYDGLVDRVNIHAGEVADLKRLEKLRRAFDVIA